MTKSSDTRAARRRRAKTSAEIQDEDRPGGETDVPDIAPVAVEGRPDCGTCRQAPACVIWVGFQQAVSQSFGEAMKNVPGLVGQAQLTLISCPFYVELEQSE